MNNIEPISVAGAGADVSTKCVECRKQIADGQWFCRLPQKGDGSAKILLCSSSCAFRHFTNSANQTIKNH